MSLSTRNTILLLQKPIITPKILPVLHNMLRELAVATREYIGAAHLQNLAAELPDPVMLENLYNLSNEMDTKRPSSFISAKGKFLRAKLKLSPEEQRVLDSTVITIFSDSGNIHRKKFAEVCFPEPHLEPIKDVREATTFTMKRPRSGDKPCILMYQIYLWHFLVNHKIELKEVPDFIEQLAAIQLLNFKSHELIPVQANTTPKKHDRTVTKLYANSDTVMHPRLYFTRVLIPTQNTESRLVITPAKSPKNYR
jgi:hypothetical protein